MPFSSPSPPTLQSSGFESTPPRLLARSSCPDPLHDRLPVLDNQWPLMTIEVGATSFAPFEAHAIGARPLHLKPLR